MLLLVAIVTGALFARTSAPPESNAPTLATPRAEAVAPIPPSAPVRSEARKTKPQPPSRAKAPSVPTASPSTLERLAGIGQATTQEASACFRDAWLAGRLNEDHVALHMTVDPASSGQALHVTAPNTDEHLWDAEACLAALYDQTPNDHLSDEPGGMIWSLRLPTEQWASELNDGMSP